MKAGSGASSLGREQREKVPVAYDEHEQAALLVAAHALGPMFVVVVLLGIDGGLRRGEILGLKWTDVEVKRGTITVRHNVVRGHIDVPKGRTEEEVGLTPRLAATSVRSRARAPSCSTTTGATSRTTPSRRGCHLRHKDLQTASRYVDRRGASSRALKALES